MPTTQIRFQEQPVGLAALEKLPLRILVKTFILSFHGVLALDVLRPSQDWRTMFVLELYQDASTTTPVGKDLNKFCRARYCSVMAASCRTFGFECGASCEGCPVSQRHPFLRILPLESLIVVISSTLISNCSNILVAPEAGSDSFRPTLTLHLTLSSTVASGFDSP